MDITCPICLDEDTVLIHHPDIVCSHTLCQTCWSKIEQIGLRCPFCREGPVQHDVMEPSVDLGSSEMNYKEICNILRCLLYVLMFKINQHIKDIGVKGKMSKLRNLEPQFFQGYCYGYRNTKTGKEYLLKRSNKRLYIEIDSGCIWIPPCYSNDNKYMKHYKYPDIRQNISRKPIMRYHQPRQRGRN